jgi:hypothetical protein
VRGVLRRRKRPAHKYPILICLYVINHDNTTLSRRVSRAITENHYFNVNTVTIAYTLCAFLYISSKIYRDIAQIDALNNSYMLYANYIANAIDKTGLAA